MAELRVIGRVDEHHRLTADVPDSVAAGPVELVIVSPNAQEDDAGTGWATGIAVEWADELADSRQDIYSMMDGEAVDDAG
jgi:hypothetical protein